MLQKHIHRQRNGQMTRVLEVTEGLASGGRESFAVGVLKSIDPDEFHLDFFTLTSERQFYTDTVLERGCSIISADTGGVNQGLGKFIKKNIALFRAVRRGNYDAVHIHGDTHLDWLKVLAARLASRRAVIILHAHGSVGLSGFKGMLGRLCRSLAANIPDARLACSHKAARCMFPEGASAEIIGNPVDAASLVRDDAARSALRERLGVGDGELLIGHAGRFSPEKNHRFIMDTFARMRAEGHRCRLLLVGEGELRPHFEQQAETLGLGDHIHFSDPVDSLGAFYNAIDVLWFPSLSESFGMVALEAQLSGTPVLISGGVPDEVMVNDNVIRPGGEAGQWISATLSARRLDRVDMEKFRPWSAEITAARAAELYRGVRTAAKEK